jgi:hypothetical protein
MKLGQTRCSPFRSLFRTPITFLLIAIGCVEVFARVGGGQSYGGGSGGGDGGDGAGAILWLIFQLIRLLLYLTIEYPAIGIPLDIIVIAGVIYFFARRSKNITVSFTAGSNPQALSVGRESLNVERSFDQLRRFDPNFSEIVFTDFCYALYAKAHDARGKGRSALDNFSPYLSDGARNALNQLNPVGLKEVKGVIVGAMQIVGVRGLETPKVNIALVFEANYTEVVEINNSISEMTYYVRERWELVRRRDVLSPEPAQATALHCPRCGAALQQDSVGACSFCGTKIDSGEFQWFVRTIQRLDRESRGPMLTADVPEVGTELPSVVQHGFAARSAEFEKNNPSFSWSEFQSRAALIFYELQEAWSNLEWERARPHETDNIFQMHQYWIDAYRRQRLRNIVDHAAITGMQPVKIKEDAFYNAITLRIWAQANDYTVNSNGEVVSGAKNRLRSWSEYWTFIRNKNAKPIAARTELSCPNCAAPLKVNAAGVCEFCGGKLTSGEFDWVLSRIEQDESYSG